jgi:hypothetical protein
MAELAVEIYGTLIGSGRNFGLQGSGAGMTPVFTTRDWKDHAYWPQIDSATRMRIKRLLNNASHDQTCGVGKPVPLKYAMGGT